MNPENATLETLETKENKTEIKPLTLAQIRELRKLGLDPALAELTMIKHSEMIDWILDNVYGTSIPDSTPYSEAAEFAIATYRKAYGRDKEIKN